LLHSIHNSISKNTFGFKLGNKQRASNCYSSIKHSDSGVPGT
jgi:hypothetical protein